MLLKPTLVYSFCCVSLTFIDLSNKSITTGCHVNSVVFGPELLKIAFRHWTFNLRWKKKRKDRFLYTYLQHTGKFLTNCIPTGNWIELNLHLLVCWTIIIIIVLIDCKLGALYSFIFMTIFQPDFKLTATQRFCSFDYSFWLLMNVCILHFVTIIKIGVSESELT